MVKKFIFEYSTYSIDAWGNVYDSDDDLMFPHWNNGYLRLRFPGGSRRYVHTLVAEAFIGKVEKGKCVNHKDGIKYHNHRSNLEIVTLAENNHHAKRIGIQVKGVRQRCAKLCEEKILKIRNLIGSKSYREITNLFEVTVSTICDIHKNRTWRWL